PLRTRDIKRTHRATGTAGLTSTALLWLMSSNLTPLAARTWSPTRMPFCSARPPGSTLGQQRGRMEPDPCRSPAPTPHLRPGSSVPQHPQW
uniref:Uncharacterized protein n=1 Tax=Falco tinnunculus TaxID=100819 RepID=A0A8C4TV90_FALTI